MSEERLSIADYPLAERRRDIVRGKRGKGLDEITLEALLEDRVTIEDLRITAAALRQQAEIARAAGRRHVGRELRAWRRARGRAARLRSCAFTSCCVLAALNRRMSFSPWPGSCATNMEPRAWRSSWKRPPRFTSGAACSKSGSEHEGMTWKTAYRSIYYDGAPEPADPDLSQGEYGAPRHRRAEHLSHAAGPSLALCR